MIPIHLFALALFCLENDSPSRGRKRSCKSPFQCRLTFRLENDSPSRGRKQIKPCEIVYHHLGLENDSPSRGRKRSYSVRNDRGLQEGLENDSPSRGRKRGWIRAIHPLLSFCLENDSPSRGRKRETMPGGKAPQFYV